MMESTLSLRYADLQAEVGFFLGWGRGNTPPYTDRAWTATQLQSINVTLASGLRRFYFPTLIVNGQTVTHDWSFLQPTSSITVPTGQQEWEMPDDFAGVNGIVTVGTSPAQFPWELRPGNEGTIRQAYQANSTATGRPQMIAFAPIRGTSPQASNRYKLLVYPITDGEYVFQMTYYVNPDFLSGARPYVYGGASHAETVLAGCKAAAEEALNDTSGLWQQRFMERLRSSIDQDRRVRPALVGYNGDRSDLYNRPQQRLGLYGFPTVTVGGVVPG